MALIDCLRTANYTDTEIESILKRAGYGRVQRENILNGQEASAGKLVNLLPKLEEELSQNLQRLKQQVGIEEPVAEQTTEQEGPTDQQLYNIADKIIRAQQTGEPLSEAEQTMYEQNIGKVADLVNERMDFAQGAVRFQDDQVNDVKSINDIQVGNTVRYDGQNYRVKAIDKNGNMKLLSRGLNRLQKVENARISDNEFEGMVPTEVAKRQEREQIEREREQAGVRQKLEMPEQPQAEPQTPQPEGVVSEESVEPPAAQEPVDILTPQDQQDLQPEPLSEPAQETVNKERATIKLDDGKKVIKVDGKHYRVRNNGIPYETPLSPTGEESRKLIEEYEQKAAAQNSPQPVPKKVTKNRTDQQTEAKRAKKKAKVPPAKKHAFPKGAVISDVVGMYDMGVELFGLSPTQALAQAIIIDRLMDTRAQRTGLPKETLYERVSWSDNKEDFKQILAAQDPGGKIMNQVSNLMHGGGVVFDRFDTAFIGTGEGVQAFGWGLYFTEIEDIAKHYAEKMRKTVGIDTIREWIREGTSETGNYMLTDAIASAIYHGDLDNPRALSDLQNENKVINEYMDQYRNDPEGFVERFGEHGFNYVQDGAKILEKLNLYFENQAEAFAQIAPAVIYKTTVHKGKSPNEYRWLQWYEPVDKKWAASLINKLPRKQREQGFGYGLSGVETQGEFYARLANAMGGRLREGQRNASLFLLENGVDGVRYPAESLSRGRDADTARGFNYAVFDAEAVSIEEVIRFQNDLVVEDRPWKGGMTRKPDPKKPRRQSQKQRKEMLERANKTYLDNVLNVLAEKFGVDYAYIDDPNNLAKGYVDRTEFGTRDEPYIVINLANATHDTPLHEFGHIFVTAIRRGNKPLYSQMVREVERTKEGRAMLEEIEQYYPELSVEERVEEAIVELLGRYAANEFNPNTGIHNSIKSIWQQIKDFLSRVFQVDFADIAPNQSIEQVAKLLAHPNIAFRDYFIRQHKQDALAGVYDAKRNLLERIGKIQSIGNPVFRQFTDLDGYMFEGNQWERWSNKVEERFNALSEYYGRPFEYDGTPSQFKEDMKQIKDKMSGSSYYEALSLISFGKVPSRLRDFLKDVAQLSGQTEAEMLLEAHKLLYGGAMRDNRLLSAMRSIREDRNGTANRILKGRIVLHSAGPLPDFVEYSPRRIDEPSKSAILKPLYDRLDRAQEKIDEPTRVREYNIRNTVINVAEQDYELRTSYRPDYQEVYISFNLMGEKVREEGAYVTQNKDLYRSVMPQILTEISRMYSDVEVNLITFDALKDNIETLKAKQHPKKKTEPNPLHRIYAYNIFAQRMFGKYSIITLSSQYGESIPMPEMFKNRIHLNSKNQYQKDRSVPPENNSNFQRWVGDRPIYQGTQVQQVSNGHPFVAKVYHGTTHSFYEFKAEERGNEGGYFGRVNYFTTSYDDASKNYGNREGSDITTLVDNKSEEYLEYLREEYANEDWEPETKRIVKDFNITPELVDQRTNFNWEERNDFDLGDWADIIARIELTGGNDQVMELYVKMNNPVVLGQQPSWFENYDNSEYYDDAVEQIATEKEVSIDEAREQFPDEITERALQNRNNDPNFEGKIETAWRNAVNELENRYDVIYKYENPDKIMDDIVNDDLLIDPMVDLNKIDREINRVEVNNAENGEYLGGELRQLFYEQLGFDGIVMQDPYMKFRMQGLTPLDSHLHVFDKYANQIKLSDGTNQTFGDTTDIRYQEANKATGARAAVLLGNNAQAIIFALTNPNVTSPIHEMVHVFEQDLTDQERQKVLNWTGHSEWDGKTSEKFTRGFEKYLSEGIAPSKELKRIFEMFKQWMLDIYNGINGSAIDLELNDEMRDLYAKMLGGQVPKRIGQGAVQATPLNPSQIRTGAVVSKDGVSNHLVRKVNSDGTVDLTAPDGTITKRVDPSTLQGPLQDAPPIQDPEEQDDAAPLPEDIPEEVPEQKTPLNEFQDRTKAVDDQIDEREIPRRKREFEHMLNVLGAVVPKYQRTTLAEQIRIAIKQGFTTSTWASPFALHYMDSLDAGGKPTMHMSVPQFLGMAYVAESNRLKVMGLQDRYLNTTYRPSAADTMSHKGKDYYYKDGAWHDAANQSVANNQDTLNEAFAKEAEAEALQEINQIRDANEQLYAAMSMANSMAGFTLGMRSKVLLNRMFTKQGMIDTVKKRNGNRPLTRVQRATIDQLFNNLQNAEDNVRRLEERNNKALTKNMLSIAEQIVQDVRNGKIKKGRKLTDADIKAAWKKIRGKADDSLLFQNDRETYEELVELNQFIHDFIATYEPDNLNQLIAELKALDGSLTDDEILDALVIDHSKFKKEAMDEAEKRAKEKKAQIKQEAKLVDKVRNILTKQFNQVKNGEKLKSREIIELQKLLSQMTDIAMTDPEMTTTDGEKLMQTIGNLQSMYDQMLISGKIFKKIDRQQMDKMLANWRNYKINGKEINDAKLILKQLHKALNNDIKTIRKIVPSDQLAQINAIRSDIRRLSRQKGEITDAQKEDIVKRVDEMREALILQQKNSTEGVPDRIDIPAMTEILNHLRAAQKVQTESNTIQALADQLDSYLNADFSATEQIVSETVGIVRQIRRNLKEMKKTNIPSMELLDETHELLEALSDQHPAKLDYTQEDLLAMLDNMRKYEQTRRIDNINKRIAEFDDVLDKIRKGDNKAALKMIQQYRDSNASATFESEPLRQARRKLHNVREQIHRFEKEQTQPGWRKKLNDLNNLWRAIVLSFDLSFVGVHGWYFGMLRHPVYATKAIGTSLRAGFNKDFFNQVMSSIQDTKEYELSQSLDNKLRIAEVGGRFETGVEEFPSEIMRRHKYIGKLYAMSERAFTLYVNLIRFHSFKAYVHANPLATRAELSLVSDQVNTLTGGSRMNQAAEQALPLASNVVIAPRLYYSLFKSTYNMLLIPDLVRMAKSKDPNKRRAYRHRLTENLRIMMAMSVPYVLAKALGGDVEDDWRTSQFLAVRYKDRVVNPHPMVPYWRLLYQMYKKGMGSAHDSFLKPVGKMIEDKFGVNLYPVPDSAFFSDKPEHQYFNQMKPMDLLFKWGRYKWSPLVSTIWSLSAGNNAIGEPLQGRTTLETVGKYAEVMLPVPIAAGEIPTYVRVIQEGRSSIPEVAGFGAIGILGHSAYMYENKLDYFKVKEFVNKHEFMHQLKANNNSKGMPEWVKMTIRGKTNPFGWYFKRDFQDAMGEYIREQLDEGNFTMDADARKVNQMKAQIRREAANVRRKIINEYEEKYGDNIESYMRP